jgi:hypothetical protein
VVCGPVRQHDVLNLQLDQLLVVPEGVAVEVGLVTQFPHVLGSHVEFRRPDGGDGEVRHVVADRAVLERGDAVFCPENALFEGFGRLDRRGQTLDALEDLEGVLPFADGVERLPVPLGDVDFPRFHRGGLHLAPGTLRPDRVVGVEIPATVRTRVLGRGIPPTVRALVAVGHLPTPVTLPAADVDCHPPLWPRSVGGVVRRCPDVPLCSTGFTDRKDRMDCRREFPLFGLFRPSHPVPDASGRPLAYPERGDGVDGLDGVVAAVVGPGPGGQRIPGPVEAFVEPERHPEGAPGVHLDHLALVMFDQQPLQQVAGQFVVGNHQDVVVYPPVADGPGEKPELLD